MSSDETKMEIDQVGDPNDPVDQPGRRERNKAPSERRKRNPVPDADATAFRRGLHNAFPEHQPRVPQPQQAPQAQFQQPQQAPQAQFQQPQQGQYHTQETLFDRESDLARAAERYAKQWLDSEIKRYEQDMVADGANYTTLDPAQAYKELFFETNNYISRNIGSCESTISAVIKDNAAKLEQTKKLVAQMYLNYNQIAYYGRIIEVARQEERKKAKMEQDTKNLRKEGYNLKKAKAKEINEEYEAKLKAKREQYGYE